MLCSREGVLVGRRESVRMPAGTRRIWAIALGWASAMIAPAGPAVGNVLSARCGYNIGMNPYASFLDGRDPRVVVSDTAARLTSHVQRLGTDGLKRSTAPGKWSAAAILCHLADCEIAFGFRLRQALAEPHHVIQPFDQDAWAKPYEMLDPRAALDLFTAARRWNLALLGTVTPQDLGKKLTHPERGEMTFATVVETMAGHDLNHLGQLERIS